MVSDTSTEEFTDGSKVTLFRERNGILKEYFYGIFSTSAYECPSFNNSVKVNLLTYKKFLEMTNNCVILSSASTKDTIIADEITSALKFTIDNNENTFWLSSLNIDNSVYPQSL